MSSKPAKTRKTPAKTHRLTEEEQAVLKVVRARKSERLRGPDLKMEYDEDTRTNTISFDHEDQLTGSALSMFETGTGDIRFYRGLLGQVASLGEPGKVISEEASDFALSVIAAVEPRDELEAMLALQMAATHQATMTMARRLNHVETLPQQDAAERALNKLARTYTTQMNTLKRYRATAQQVVRVERLTVNEGGQAIVGPVSHAGGGDGKK